MNDLTRKIQAAIAAAVGLFLIFINPGLVTANTNMFLKGMTDGATAPMNPVVSLRSTVSFGWLGITVYAGVVLLVAVVYGFLKNKDWAFPTALVSLATLPIGSFYVSSFAGFMIRKKVFAPSFYAFVVGLLAFWALILLEKKGKELWALFVPLTFLGMIGTQAFAFAEHGLRGLYQGGKTEAIIDPSIGILRFSQPIMVMVLITLIFAIYYLAMKKEAGWWLSMFSGAAMAVATYSVHLLVQKPPFLLKGQKPLHRAQLWSAQGHPRFLPLYTSSVGLWVYYSSSFS
ncbi:MAG: hypothetical protein J7L35_09430 [Anaerolineales bacterium]|nr:hypothetical protein [Anaerolineales bacterium]